MEGAVGFIIGTGFSKLYEVADDINNIYTVFEGFYGGVIYHKRIISN